MPKRMWPGEDVPESGAALPQGIIKFKIEKFEERNSSNGKFMIVGHYRCVAPKEVKNMPFTEFMCVGTDDDPQAEDPKTFKTSGSARRFKTRLKKAGVRIVRDLAKQYRLAVGHEFCASVIQELDEDSGYINNRLRAIFEPGEKKPYIEDDSDADAETPAPKKGKGKGKPKRQVEEEEEEEVEEEEDEEEDDEDEEVEEEDEEASDDLEEEEEAEEEEEPKRPSRGRSKKARK